MLLRNFERHNDAKMITVSVPMTVLTTKMMEFFESHFPPSTSVEPVFDVVTLLWHKAHTQESELVLPGEELVLEGQVAQAADPDVALYFPASQTVHPSPPSRPVYPLLHAQWAAASLPAAEYECAGQSLQAADPDVALYFPTLHGKHGPPAAPWWPWNENRMCMTKSKEELTRQCTVLLIHRTASLVRVPYRTCSR